MLFAAVGVCCYVLVDWCCVLSRICVGVCCYLLVVGCRSLLLCVNVGCRYCVLSFVVCRWLFRFDAAVVRLCLLCVVFVRCLVFAVCCVRCVLSVVCGLLLSVCLVRC